MFWLFGDNGRRTWSFAYLPIVAKDFRVPGTTAGPPGVAAARRLNAANPLNARREHLRPRQLAAEPEEASAAAGTARIDRARPARKVERGLAGRSARHHPAPAQHEEAGRL